MHFVGIRELKNRLTYYLRLTTRGDNVVVTDRGRPMAILHSLESIEETAGLEETLISMSAKGWIRLPAPRARFTKAAPIDVKGKPVSRIIIEERR